MGSPSAAEMLRFQLRHAWLTSRRVLDGLTEDEYFWEPAAPCWSIRPRSAGLRGWGAGDFVCEDAWPPPDPLPATTIGWRVIHLAAWTDVYRGFAFAETRPDLNDADVPGTAAEGVAWLIRAQDAFIDAVERSSDDALLGPLPAHWGQPAPGPRLISPFLVEHVHHLAEVGTLRDLHRGHAVTPPPVTIPAPAWWTGS